MEKHFEGHVVGRQGAGWGSQREMGGCPRVQMTFPINEHTKHRFFVYLDQPDTINIITESAHGAVGGGEWREWREEDPLPY